MYHLNSYLLSILFLIQIIKIKTFFEENCKIISSTSPYECLECKENYNLINGDCPCYDRNCDSCLSSYPGGCLSCKSPFTFNPKTNSCICNIDNCLFCSEQGCDQCEFGYYLYNNFCFKNFQICYDKNCRICSNTLNGSCKVCYDGYNLEYGTCQLNPSNPRNNLCSEDYFQVENFCNKNCLEAECYNDGFCENECLNCKNNILSGKLNCKPLNYCYDSHCISCRNNKEGYCDKCEIGYRLYNGICSKCEDKNCLNCDYTNDGKCNSCMNGYFLINDKCISINETEECYNNNGCKKCLKENNNYCFECLPEYFLQNGTCIKHYIGNCIQYSDDKCVKCSDDYVNDKNGNECIKNKGNIPHCLNYNSYKECKQCERNYELKYRKDFFTTKKNECVLKNDFIYSCTSYECMSYYDKYSQIEINESNEERDIDHDFQENENNIINYYNHHNSSIYIDIIILIICFVVLIIPIIICCCCCPPKITILKHKLDIKCIKQITQQDQKLEKCNFCKNELAIYKLNCGCKICDEDSKNLIFKKFNDNNIINNKDFNKINNKIKCDKNKNEPCPVCKKIIKNIKQIALICNICLDVSSRLFKFSCGCSMMVCKNCFNRIFDTKICPGCRKKIS